MRTAIALRKKRKLNKMEEKRVHLKEESYDKL
jgi:hypothetical protein